MPQARPFLYVDDTLVWIEGNPTEVEAAVKELKEITGEYGDYTGQRLNMAKCAAILQGDWPPLPITSIEGITVEPYVHYLGWHLGSMAPYNQYAAGLRKFETKAQQLGTLPLTDKEQVAALNIWA